MEENTRGWQLHGFAAVGSNVGALSANSFVARRRRHLLLPTRQDLHLIVQSRLVQSGGVACRDNLTEGVEGVRFGAPYHLGLVDLGHGVEELEELGRLPHEDQEQPLGEGIERAAMTH